MKAVFFLSALVVAIPFTLVSPFDGLFAAHVLLMPIFLALASLSAAVMRSPSFSLQTRWTLHGSFNGLAVLAGIGGATAIYLAKEQGGRSHLMSWHSWFGAAALVMSFGASFAGSMAFQRMRIFNIKIGQLHRSFGPIAGLMISVATASALFTNFVGSTYLAKAVPASLSALSLLWVSSFLPSLLYDRVLDTPTKKQ